MSNDIPQRMKTLHDKIIEEFSSACRIGETTHPVTIMPLSRDDITLILVALETAGQFPMKVKL
jgi:hypothetical protein